MNAEEAYESYVNGNRSEVSSWLRKAHRVEVINFCYYFFRDGANEGNLIKLRSMAGAR